MGLYEILISYFCFSLFHVVNRAHTSWSLCLSSPSTEHRKFSAWQKGSSHEHLTRKRGEKKRERQRERQESRRGMIIEITLTATAITTLLRSQGPDFLQALFVQVVLSGRFPTHSTPLLHCERPDHISACISVYWVSFRVSLRYYYRTRKDSDG